MLHVCACDAKEQMMVTVDELTLIREQLQGLLSVVTNLETRTAALQSANLRDIERRLIAARRHVLPQSYFAHGAWDILVDLEAALRRGEHMTFPDPRFDTMPPVVTPSRFLASLEADGLISRTPDPDDSTRSIVALTPAGCAALDAIFDDVPTHLDQEAA
jgi:hypothetical protein